MKSCDVYEQWREETLSQGIQQGIQQGVQQGIQQEAEQNTRSFLAARFGGIDPELEALVLPLCLLNPSDRAQCILRWSREELIARFGVESESES